MKANIVFIISFLIFFKSESWAANSITVTPSAVATTLNYSVNTTNLVVATIDLSWDGPDIAARDFTVSIRGQYGGFRHTGGLGTLIPYSLRYEGTTKAITTADQLFYSFNIAAFAPAGTRSSDLDLTFTGIPYASLYSGTYEDTLTITYELL